MATSREAELVVDRARDALAASLGQLRRNIEPRNLIDEVTQASGLRDVTPSNALDLATAKHPIATVLLAMGLGFWAYSRTFADSHNPGSLGKTMAALTDAATDVFRERVAGKRDAFVDTSKAHIAATATGLSDVIERNIDHFVGNLPGNSNFRPLIQSAMQVAAFVALEAVLRQRPSH